MNQEALNYWRYVCIIAVRIYHKKGVLSLQIKQGEHHFPSKNVFTNWVFQWVGLVFTFSRDTRIRLLFSSQSFLKYSKKKRSKLFYLYFQFLVFSIALLFLGWSPSKWQTTLPLHKVSPKILENFWPTHVRYGRSFFKSVWNCFSAWWPMSPSDFWLRAFLLLF